jgi:hypothetical protein
MTKTEEYPKPDYSRFGAVRDFIARHTMAFILAFIATPWYARMIEGSIRLGLQAAREEEYNSRTVPTSEILPDSDEDD